MSWQAEVDRILERRRLALELGGAKAVEKHRQRGKRTVRERIASVLDPESLIEEGPMAGWAEEDVNGRLEQFVPANFVLGRGTIDGRPVVAGGEDFTQRGGSPTPSGLRKSVWSEQFALQHRMPLVRFLEGGGGSVTGSGGKGARAPVGDPVYTPARFQPIVQLLDVAPVVSIAAGAVAGFPAGRLVAAHLAIQVQEIAQVLIGGPALVQRALGEDLDKEELGGWRVHRASGVIDRVARDEQEAIALARQFLSYLPSNVLEAPPQAEAAEPEGDAQDLLSIVPRDRRRLYAIDDLLTLIFDRGSLFERGELFGRSQRTFLARCGGRPVAVWANDPRHLGGAMDAEGALKARRFVEFCERFHLPMVAFVDEPGFLIGSRSERQGTIRYGMEAIAATMKTSVPWLSIVIRRAYGVAAAAHFGPDCRTLMWPSADLGALPVEGGVAVAFRREIAAAADPDAKRAELEAELAARRTPFPRAESFSAHDLIDPRETRAEILNWLDLVQARLREHVALAKI